MPSGPDNKRTTQSKAVIGYKFGYNNLVIAGANPA
jgi:hypothetical protein